MKTLETLAIVGVAAVLLLVVLVTGLGMLAGIILSASGETALLGVICTACNALGFWASASSLAELANYTG